MLHLSALFIFLLAVSDVLAATAGCGKTPLTSGTKSLTVNGKTRQFILRVPDNYNSNTQYKLIFGFHGLGDTMQQVATGSNVGGSVYSYFGLQKYGANSAIFVAPAGLNAGWANTNGEDVAFVDAMIKYIGDGLCVNENLIFSTGFSYGGGMSYALACARRVRAVAVLSGSLLSGCDGGTMPVAYYGQHGIGDPVLPIANGRSLRDTFVRNNGCTQRTAATVPSGSLTHAKTTYTGCRSGFPVTWVEFDGGHIRAPADGRSGEQGAATWSPQESWDFLSQFT